VTVDKKLLLVAFHFPPFAGGSGVHRAAKFVQYLPENGWQPYVVTANPRAYASQPVKSGPSSDGTVKRAFALDAQRHLSFKGRYLRALALPDRWSSWVFGAVPQALATVYRRNIDVIMVTFPIATAVLIGLILQRLTGKPLVLDFRDSMTEEAYPRDPRTRRLHRRIESLAIQSSSLVIFTTVSTRRMYLERYPNLAARKCVVIPNGYDEGDFDAVSGVAATPTSEREPVRMVHAGVIYTDDRDPRSFFQALSRLKAQGVITSASLRIELRASGSEAYYEKLLRELAIENIVHLLPPLPHRSAIEDLVKADALLLFQAASCNHQIPAKVYEYFRLGKPVLALTSSAGDTAAVLREVGGATIVELDDEDAIYQAIPSFLKAVQTRTHSVPDPNKARNYTRKSATLELARELNKLILSEVGHQDLAPAKD
jgi:glycosyltransferase involved in cell wall biosynthesis